MVCVANFQQSVPSVWEWGHKMLVLVFAMLLAAEGATTTCAVGAAGEFTCATRDSSSAPNMACAGNDWLIAGCTFGSHREAREARAAQQRVIGAREATMNFLRAGDCEAAVGTALETGDLRFATDVRAFCSAGARQD